MTIEVDIEVLSLENIKPSSPTPHHLHTYKLSFLDQICPPIFMPLVIFYPPDSDNQKRSDHLKTSLSETLTRFYPLAGQLVDDLYINCNDSGVPYYEARCNCQLMDVISDPKPNELLNFLPCALDDVKDFPLVIQTTFFNCGGMAVAIGLSHKVGDALSLFMFTTAWAAIARGETNIVTPRFESAALFPPRDTEGFKPRTGIVTEKIVGKRFVFTAAKIAALRDKYAEALATEVEENTQRPTRIEALSAFIWSRFVASTGMKADTSKIFTVLHAVNLRTRTNPPLATNYFGNISRLAITMPDMENVDEDLNGGIIRKMRDAIRGVNGEYVKMLQEGEKHLKFMKERAKQSIRGDIVTLNFTSLCRFPMYEMDFGWGKPIWVGSPPLTFKNLVVFMDTQSGGGIEALMNLKEEDMAKFEVDEELLSYVSPAPSHAPKKVFV